MSLTGDCPDCRHTFDDTQLTDLPDGHHGVACPECGTDVYCGICGDLTV